MTDPSPALFWISLIFFLAGMVKGVVGLGLPTMAMGLLGLVMAPSQAAALLVLPSLVTNVWQLTAGRALGSIARRLWPMMLGVAGGTLAGAGLIAAGAEQAAAWLGVALLLYGVTGLGLPTPRLPRAAEPWAGPLAGALTGLITGATGVFVIPAVPYLGALGLDRDSLVQALGLSFTVSTLALAGGLALHGALPTSGTALSLLSVVPALGGMTLGGRLRTRVPAPVFRRVFFIGLILLGAELIGRGLRA